MGSSSSKPSARPPPPLLLKPWLKVDWGNRESDLQFINSYKPEGEGQKQLRILLHGKIGAGKSSFINSVISTLEGKICCRAPVCTDQNSFTKEYITYHIKKENPGNEYPFVLNDMMGLNSGNRRHRRVHVKDMKKVMKGNIGDGYNFNPESTLSKKDHFYNQNPTINDKVHILVSVIDASTAGLLKLSDVETLQDIRDEATDLRIPHVAILAKIDEACPELKTDLKNVCWSRMLQEKVQEFSKVVGIPENCIFPVKNYHSERELDHDIDALILNTLRRIIEIGEEYCRSQKRLRN